MFGLVEQFRIIPFILGLVGTYVVLSFYKPDKQIIRQYPHPSDTEDKIFRDPSGTCYKYSTHEVNCDANEATLTDYPIQG
jgi:hypothetical protein